MTLAAIDWLSISINLLLVIFVIVCLLMTLVILMQRPKQEGLGAAFGAGVTDQVFGARTTNVLQRGTVYLGSAFFLLSFLLAILIGLQNKTTTLTGAVPEEASEVQETPVPETPRSLSDELPDLPPVTPSTPDVDAPDLPPTDQPDPVEIPADGTETEIPTEEPAVDPAQEENSDQTDSEENTEQP